MPKPISVWSTEDKHWLLPMYFVLSIAWSLELYAFPLPVFFTVDLTYFPQGYTS